MQHIITNKLVKQGFDKGEAIKSTALPQGLAMHSRVEAANVACVDMAVEVDAPSDLLFSILADPNTHPHVFQAIEGAESRLIHEQGSKRRYELDYKARWRFWRVSGVCDNRLFMDTDSEAGTVSFKLREPGFLRVYEGTWSITPLGSGASQISSTKAATATVPAAPARASSLKPAWAGLFSGAMLASINNPILDLQRHLSGKVQAAAQHPVPESSPLQPPNDQQAQPAPTSGRSVIRVHGLRMSPKIAPPRPLGNLLKGHAAGQIEDMLKGLLAATQSIEASIAVSPPCSPVRNSSSSSSSLADEESSGRSSPTTPSNSSAFSPASWLKSHRISIEYASDGEI